MPAKKHRFSRWVVLAVAGCLAATALAAGAVVATGSESSSSPHAPSSHREPTLRSAADNPSPVALQRFGIFRDNSARPSDAAAIAGKLPSNMAIDPSSVRVASRDGGNTTHVMAGPSYVCMRVTYKSGVGSSGCSQVSGAADGSHPMIDVTTVGDQATRVTALLPDGISEMVLAPDGHPAVTLPVSNNVASGTMAADNGVVAWTTPDGAKHSLRLLAG